VKVARNINRPKTLLRALPSFRSSELLFDHTKDRTFAATSHVHRSALDYATLQNLRNAVHYQWRTKESFRWCGGRGWGSTNSVEDRGQRERPSSSSFCGAGEIPSSALQLFEAYCTVPRLMTSTYSRTRHIDISVKMTQYTSARTGFTPIHPPLPTFDERNSLPGRHPF
jgi:hypothetical protein